MRKTIKENKQPWPMRDNATPIEYSINQWLDKLDTKACEMESRWGVNRLERLVSFEMAEKWKRQISRLNDAISKNDLYTLPDLVNGTIRGYEAMEADAMAQGHKPHDAPLAWTVGMPSGKTLAIVRHPKDASLVNDLKRDHGDVVVWTIDEIAAIIDKDYILVNVVKEALPRPEDRPFDFGKGDPLPDGF